MIVIDTNVVSELMRAAPNEAVLDWFGRRAASDLHISAVTEAELRRGAQRWRRNIGDFEGCGIDVVNPWDEATVG